MNKSSEKNILFSAIFNFFIWGAGYLYCGEYFSGFLWLLAFTMTHLPIFYLGLGFYQTTIPGTSLLAGHLIISIILLYRGLKKEADSECWQHIIHNWKLFFSSTLIIGLVSEIINKFLLNHW